MHSMKKRFALFLALIMAFNILAFEGLTFASKYSEFESVTVFDESTGKSGNYEPVALTVFGHDVFTDTPGVTVDGRVLVPLAGIFQSAGTPYQWSQATKEISFKAGGKSVVVQINNPYAKVDGKKVELPDRVAPRIMRYTDTQGVETSRTYVPVRFISEMLGLDVNWLGSTRTVAVFKAQQVLSKVDLFWKTTAQRPYPEIRLKVSGQVDYTSFVARGLDVGGLDQTVIDFQNTKFTMPEGGQLKNGVWTYTIADGIYGLEKVEVLQTSDFPARTRVRIYKSRRQGHDIYYDATKKEMVVRIINTVNNISLENIYDTNTIVIDTGETMPAINYKTYGNFIYVDFLKATFNKDVDFSNVKGIEKGKIKSVSYKEIDKVQYGKEAVRVAIELTEKPTVDNHFVEPDGTKIRVYVPDDALNMFKYIKTDTYMSQLFVTLNDLSYQKQVVTEESKNKIVLKMPLKSTNMNSISEQINDNMLKSVKVEIVKDQYVITAELYNNSTFKKIMMDTTVGYVFEYTPPVVSEGKGKLIVIDPGHGGKDPGTVGSKGTEEAVVLQTSLKLKNELERMGYTVYMTRTTNEYVNLYDRPAIANSMNATVFVSVHANGFKSSAVKGIEVYYGDAEDKKLADLMQKELIAATGAVNRGAKAQPKYVVIKESKMPTVLAELGFMSNPEEERNLMSDAYQEKLAKAMAQAILKYLK